MQDGSPERDPLPSGDLSGVFLTKSQWLLSSMKPVAGVTCIRTLEVSQGRAVDFRVICSASGLCPPSHPPACVDSHGLDVAGAALETQQVCWRSRSLKAGQTSDLALD